MNPIKSRGPHPSLWADITEPAPRSAPLAEMVRADVAIVGAGVLGCSTALHLAQRGAKVVVVEADEAGFGASGRNNGQVIPAITRPDPEDIVRACGEIIGRRMVRLIGGSATYTFDLARAHSIRCDATQNGWIQPAHRESRLEISKRRVRQWTSHGFDVRMMSREEVAEKLGSDRYHGGWTAPTGGHLNPLALTRGLARAAISAGARIHCWSPAASVRREGSGWRVTTPAGAIDAPKVLLATAGYTDGLWPGLARTIVPVTNWQLSTFPLPPEVRSRVIPANVAMSDTHGDLRFARLDPQGRLISGTSLIVPYNSEARLRVLVAQRLRDLFPALRDLPALEFDHAWNGEIAMTSDFLPHFHEIDAGMFAALGCNGRGLGVFVALGKSMADALLGAPAADLDFPLMRPRAIPLHAIARRVGLGMLAWYRFLDMRD